MSILKNISVATTGAVLITFGTVGTAQTTTLVAPSSATNTEGNTFFPEAPFAGGSPVWRYQQVYAASEFSSLPEPQYINQISFRPDTTLGNPFASVLPSVQIYLSTTKSAPDGLSIFFSQNIGANNTLVYNGSLPLSSADSGSTGKPKDFDIDINLQKPFLYNPAQGNLLLEVKKLSGGNPTTAFDGQFVSSDSISSLSTSAFSEDLLNGITKGSIGSSGLVTQFTTTPAATTPPPTLPVPAPLPSDPTPIPFEFSPSLGILLIGAWGAIAQLKSLVQKRKSAL